MNSLYRNGYVNRKIMPIRMRLRPSKWCLRAKDLPIRGHIPLLIASMRTPKIRYEVRSARRATQTRMQNR